MSATEYNDWVDHFSRTPFMPQLIDVEFAALHGSVYSAMCGAKTEITDFMLLTDIEPNDEDMPDDVIQSVSEGITGGVRYEQPNRGS